MIIQYLLLGLIYPLAVMVITYLLFGRLWRGARGWIFIGVGYMLLAIIIQIPIQEAPGLALALRSGLLNLATGAAGSMGRWEVPLAIYAGIIAGAAQETAKFFSVKDREARASLWIGYGFSLIDVAVLVIETAAIVVLGRAASLPAVSAIGFLANPVVSAIFHPGTAMFLRRYQGIGQGTIGLLATTLAHSYMDSLVSYLNVAVAMALIGPQETYVLVGILWASSLALAAAFFLAGLRGVGAEAGKGF